MKYIFYLFFLISINVKAQDLEVLLIGVSHDYSKYPAQNFSSIHQKIRKFKPDVFFGEFLSKEGRAVGDGLLVQTTEYRPAEKAKKQSNYKRDIAAAYY